MATDLTERIQEIAEAQGIPESEILEQALERGVEDLWIDLVLSRYVNDGSPERERLSLLGETALSVQNSKFRRSKTMFSGA